MTETNGIIHGKDCQDYGSGVTRPKINNGTHFKLKGQFLKELRDNTFSGSEHKDANKHIEKVLEIVDLFHIPNVTQDQIMLRGFPVSLTRAASRWLRNEPACSILTWEVLKSKTIGENAVEHIGNFLKVVGPLKIRSISHDRFRLSVFPVSLSGTASEWFKKECIGSVTTWEDLVEKFVQKFYRLSYNNEEMEANEDDNFDEMSIVAEIFKIEGNLFDYETPLCKAYNDFYYLLKIDANLFTLDVQEIKTYEEYKYG
ncbi:hypothetical protein Tco_0363075 [Tanacetum coccineum]